MPAVSEGRFSIWQVRQNHRKPRLHPQGRPPPQGEHRFPEVVVWGGRIRSGDVGRVAP
jgi:hypothetical protein